MNTPVDTEPTVGYNGSVSTNQEDTLSLNSSSDRTASIIVSWHSANRLAVYSPFAFKDAVKAIPGARWDKDAKHWTIPNSTHSAETLARSAKAAALRIEGDSEWEATLHRARIAYVERTRSEITPEAELVHVPGKTEAWTHQKRAFSFARNMDACMLGMDMGTGKSRAAIGLLEEWKAENVLILCPVSVMDVWPKQFREHAERDWRVCVARGGSWERAAQVLREHQVASAATPFVYVCNYESAWRGDLGDTLADIVWDVVLCDESHRIKSAGGRASQFAHKLGQLTPRRLCLTGTPLAHSPLDAYGQYRFLDEGVFGTSYHRFSHRYGIYGGYGGFELIGYNNMDEFAERIGRLTFQCRAEDVLDLPEAHDVERTCTLEPSARKAYREMASTFVTEVKDGMLIAANAAVKVLRLQQLASGSLPDPDTNEPVVMSTAKRDLLKDILTDLPDDEPVVVFARFTHDLAQIRAVAAELGREYGEVSGRTKNGLSDEATIREGVRILGVQIQSGGVGVDFVAARVAIFYSVGYSLADYLQARKRVHRPGQSRTVTYLHLITEGTYDRVVYRALAERKDVVDAVMAAAEAGQLGE